MADLQHFLLFVHYEEEFEQSKNFVLPRRNPFQEYDDAKFRQRFRLIFKVHRHKTAGLDTLQNLIIDTSCRQIS